MSCGVSQRHGSDLVLLWLWCRPATATAPIGPLTWEPPKRIEMNRKKKNKKKKKKKKKKELDEGGPKVQPSSHEPRNYQGCKSMKG